MTSRNMTSNSPFLLKPVGKDYLWGGNRLKEDFAKELDITPLAETWECSAHPDGPSVAASGRHKGKTLDIILEEHPEYLGYHGGRNGTLSVLVKLIDASEDLSVQVHPNDAYAMGHENGSLGKTEMWYILDAEKDSELVYGFRQDVSREIIEESLKDGTVEDFLQKIPVCKNNVFLIEPGMVHAIGSGILLAEIQESSNLTYRLYDYGRKDVLGRQRPLHIRKALDVLNYRKSGRPRQPMRVLNYRRGCASELLCRCRYFQVERLLFNTAQTREMATVTTGSSSCQIYLCIGGCGTLFTGGGDIIPFIKGDCIFFPADSAGNRLHGKAQILKITC